ncbi:MAG: glycosyltransferase [Motilibacteraceae bacterium]
MSDGVVGVAIPAHDEEHQLPRLLARLATPAMAGRLDVVVVCNGCDDATADVARAEAPWARVVEIPQASKPAALDVADSMLSAWPRVYLDADVLIDGADVVALAGSLRPPMLAAAPTVRNDTGRSSRLVRHYYRASELAALRCRSVNGSGAIAVSREGRARFGAWPDVLADDFFLDTRFSDVEKLRTPHAHVDVVAPAGLDDLVRRKIRVQAGNAEVRRRHPTAFVPAPTSVLELVRQHPRRSLDLALFAAVSAWCRLVLAVRGARGVQTTWQRDASRTVQP